jgi:hypothetical protein
LPLAPEGKGKLISGEDPERKGHENMQNVTKIASSFNNLKSPIPVNLKKRQNSKMTGFHSQSRHDSNLEEGKNIEHSSDDDDVTLNAIIVRREGEYDDNPNARCDENLNSMSTSTSVGNSLVDSEGREKDGEDKINLEERDIEGGKAGMSLSKPGSNGREGGTVRSFLGYFRGGMKRMGDDGEEGESNTITLSIMDNSYKKKEDGRMKIKDITSPSPLCVPSSPIAIAVVRDDIIISRKEITEVEEVIISRKKWRHTIWNKILKRCRRNTSTFWVASARQFRLFNRSIG